MPQFVPCDGCGNQVPTPEIREGQPTPQFLSCEACGNEVYWDIELTDDSEPLIPFSIEQNGTSEITAEHENENDAIAGPSLLELELESETADSIGDKESSPSLEQQAGSQSTPDWSLLGPAIPRRRPREVSAIRKIVPPILGGLAAFPIATLIMWYGFGKDIGSTGPTVAQYVPWIVPQKLRATQWEYSSFDSNRSGSANTQSRRPSTLPRTRFPSLNQENSGDEATDTPVEKGTFQPKENIATNSTLSKPVDDAVVAKPPISETIAKLRTLQKEWSNTSKADQVKMVGEYNSAITQLSEQAAELKGRSATIWRKELETIAREILVHPNVPTVIQRGPIGKLPGVPEASNGDFIATVVKIGEENKPTPNDSWNLMETWSTGKVEIPIEIMPGAWRVGASTLPKTCLIFGKLVANEASQLDMVLKVHAVLPQ